jgi:hypothetical protein
MIIPLNPAVNEPDRFERIATDIAYLSQFLREYDQLIRAAREVTFQRYHADTDDSLGANFPTVSKAIFQLANLVGIPPTDPPALASQQRHAAT